MSKATDPPITSESSDNRTPLPALGQAECTSNKHAGLWPRVADALLPKWPHELEGERWFSTDDAYVDQEFDLEALPFWLRDTSVGWVRAPSLSSQSAQSASSEILVKTSIISNEEFVTDDQSNVRSAQAVENTALAEWSETAIDAITNKPLPQVVVLPPQTDRGPPPPDSLPLERGFALADQPNGIATSSKEQDEIGASLLRLVAMYARQCDQNKNKPFLWEAIYPQDRSGRPCYNPGGKYVVKVFFCGSWRRVQIDDRVPINARGQATIVFSRERRELWPFILAKAAYKVAHLAYRAIPSVDESSPQALFDLVAIATTALTGWAPSPIHIPSKPGPINAFTARLTQRGTPECSLAEINLASTNCFPGSSLNRHSKPSGRRRRGQSREVSNEMLNQASMARSTAARMTKNKLMAAREELIVLVETTETGVCLHPLLGVLTYPEANSVRTDKRNITNCFDAILEWSCAKSGLSDFESGPLTLPPTTLRKPICHITDRLSTSCLLSFSTQYGLPFTARLQSSWVESASGVGFVSKPLRQPGVLHINTSCNSATLVACIQTNILTAAPLSDDSTTAGPRPTSIHTLQTRSAVLTLEELVGFDPAQTSEEDGRFKQENSTFCYSSTESQSTGVSLRLVQKITGPYPSRSGILYAPLAPKGRAYRVCLDAPFGADVTFNCTAPVSYKTLPPVCEQLGGWSTSANGTYDAVHTDCEIVVFQRVIELINPVVDVNAPAETSNTDANCKEEQVPKTTSLACFPETPQFMDIALELSVSDPTAANNITLHTLDIDENVSTTHSLLRLQKVRLRERGFIVSATLRAPSNTPISAGSWSLIAYSATSLPRPQLLHIKELDGAGTQEEGMTYRFGSMYSPNKHLRLFRDILEVPQACFPLSINLDVIHTEDLPVRFVIGESTEEINPSSTSSLERNKETSLRSASCASSTVSPRKSFLGIRRACVPCFWPKQAKHAPRDSGTERPDKSPANLNIVLEAKLDTNFIRVDDTLYSPQPYASQSLSSKQLQLSDAPFSPAQRLTGKHLEASWILTLHASAGGLLLRHNDDQERTYQVIQNEWEARESGRGARAKDVQSKFGIGRTRSTERELTEDYALGSRFINSEIELKRERPRSALRKILIEAVRPGHEFLHDRMKSKSALLKPYAWDKKAAEAYGVHSIEYAQNSMLHKWRQCLLKGTTESLLAREQHRVKMQQKATRRSKFQKV